MHFPDHDFDYDYEPNSTLTWVTLILAITTIVSVVFHVIYRAKKLRAMNHIIRTMPVVKQAAERYLKDSDAKQNKPDEE